VGPGAIARIASAASGISAVRNPLAATGGRDPEALEQVRQFAPRAFRTQERAVTEADYAEIAERRTEIQKAAATFRWTGSWFTAFVTVDRRAGAPVDAPFRTTLTDYLEPFRMAGYDLEVTGPTFVPLDVALAVCVRPGYFQNDVKQALLDVFSSRDLPDGTRGFFHPDNFTFGQSLYLSQIYQVALQVSGVASLDVTRFQRWSRGANHELERAVVAAAPLEILQLANDPSFPENGRLSVTVAGGL
jgi:predicted phage baseplate assembly protein